MMISNMAAIFATLDMSRRAEEERQRAEEERQRAEKSMSRVGHAKQSEDQQTSARDYTYNAIGILDYDKSTIRKLLTIFGVEGTPEQIWLIGTNIDNHSVLFIRKSDVKTLKKISRCELYKIISKEEENESRN